MWRALRGRGKRGIFRFEPRQQDTAFFGLRSDDVDQGGRWRRGRGGRIDDLKDVKTEQVQDDRSGDEAKQRKLSAPGRAPIEDRRELAGCCRSRRHYFGGALASETDVMPCSSAAFVTATTISYGVSRSALMITGRPSFSAASSNGPS